MATEGYVEGNTVDNGCVYVYWRLDSQNQAANTSTIAWEYGWYFKGSPTDRQLDNGFLAIAGTVCYNVPGRVRDYPIGGYGVRRYPVAYGYTTIQHESNGYGPFNITAWLTGWYNAHSQIISAWFQLPRIPKPPNPPGQPVITGSGNSRTITWTNGGDNGAPITAFHLYRAENAAFTQGKVGWDVGLATSKVDTGLSYKKTYYYQVFAISSAGNTPSAVSSVTIGDAPPNAPGLPTVSDLSPVGAKATWSAATVPSGASPVTNYDIEVRTTLTGTPTATNIGNVTTYNLTGLSPSTTYQVRVRAKSDGGTSPWSAARSFTTLPSLYVPNATEDAWVTAVPYMVVNGVWRPVQILTPGGGGWV